MAFTPGQDALPNPSPGSGMVLDVNGNPAAPMPTAAAPGPQSAAPAPAATAYSPNSTTPSSGSIRYPWDVDYNGTDYMIFEFFEYEPPFGKNSGITNTTSPYSGYNKTAQLSKKVDGLNQIILYMPEDVSVSYKGEWTGKKFSNIGAGILSSAGGIKDGNFQKALQDISNTAGGAVKRLPAQLGAQAVNTIISSITGESISQNDIFSSIGGQILNPNTELIFGGQDLRTFTFTYKLVAYNSTESLKIQEIIRTFKKAMLPTFSTDKLDYKATFASPENTNNVQESVPNIKGDSYIGFIKNPALVQPYFMHNVGVHPYLPRFKPCTITDFDVNYTADGVYAAHDDGAPVSATITISLLETKLIYAEDINKGF